MNKSQATKILKTKIQFRHKLILLLIAILMFPLFFVSKNYFISSTQTKDRNDKKMTKESFNDEPIEIINLKSNGEKLKLNEKFNQTEDWLKNFTIEFKNTSGKTITYISIVMGFPETDSSGNRMVYFLTSGVNPMLQNKSKNEPMLLRPNESAELKLSDERYTNLKNFLATRKHSLEDLSELHLTIMVVYFEDGMKWGAGTMFRPDPNNAGKFLPVEKDSQEEEK